MPEKFEAKIFKFGIGAAVLEIIYCAAVAWLLLQLQLIVVKAGISLSVTMLLVLVFSAALSGFLIFGYPVYLVTQKQFRSAILTLLISLATLFMAALVLGASIIIFK
jgi:hypothetical protein